ncbi:hypothetical protein DB346_05435 [Verrucomicrobia bacterium LW23]|nr:hypothetical protein DB346_05435 [Verrucomicrobia bacterium LW23]
MLPHVDASMIGIDFPESITEEQFREVGSLIAGVQRSLPWYWGDWLAFASQSATRAGRNARMHIDDGPALYHLAEELSHLSYQTLRNYKSVCEAIPLYRRKYSLSFTHHQIVANIPDPAEQDNWLDEAEKKGWSVSELRMAIRLAYRTEEPVEGRDDGSRRSQILREMESLASLLKKERVEDLPPATQDVWMEQLKPIVATYEILCELRE